MEDLTPKEVINEIERALRAGKEVMFRNFGLRNSAIYQLKDIERSEVEIKRKNYMLSVEISRKFLKDK